MALGVLPLVIVPNTALGGETVFLVPKLVWLAVVLVPASLLLVRKNTVDVRALTIPALLVMWMFVASLLHDDRWRSIAGRSERYDGALAHTGLLICSLGGAALIALGRRRALGMALARGAIAVAVVSIAQRIGVVPALASQDRSILLVDMPGSLIGNRGYTACFLAAMLPFAIERAQATSVRRRAGWILGVSLVAGAVGLGWTRGASIAAIVALLAYVAAARGTRRSAAAIAGVAIAGLIVGTVFAPSTRTGGSAGHVLSSANSGRGVLYRAAVAGISRNPIVGLGAGGVLRALSDTDPNTVLRWANLEAQTARVNQASTAGHLVIDGERADGSMVRYDSITTKAHNELLDYAVSYGIPAALLAAAMFVLALVRVRRDAALFASLVGAAAGMLTWPQVMRTAPILWALLGAALAHRPKQLPATEQFVEHELGDLVNGRNLVTSHIEHLGRQEGLDPVRAPLKADDQRHRVTELRRKQHFEQLALTVQVSDCAESGSDLEHSREGLLVGAPQGNGVAVRQPRDATRFRLRR